MLSLHSRLFPAGRSLCCVCAPVYPDTHLLGVLSVYLCDANVSQVCTSRSMYLASEDNMVHVCVMVERCESWYMCKRWLHSECMNPICVSHLGQDVCLTHASVPTAPPALSPQSWSWAAGRGGAGGTAGLGRPVSQGRKHSPQKVMWNPPVCCHGPAWISMA